jgi:hypothetical protein
MTPNPEIVRALADTYTLEQLHGIRQTALEVNAEAGTGSRSYEGSSFSISKENCAQIIAECNAAIDAKRTASDGNDPILTQTPMGIRIDYSRRRIE